jgi:8-oxo-dGTP diphosphatase
MTHALGTAVAIVRDGASVLLGRRIAAHGNGLLQFPGGKPDAHETPTAAAIRETLEETGLRIAAPIEVARQVDDFPEIEKRYETVFFVAWWDGDEPVNREPHKCEGWAWYPLAALPADLFAIDDATIAAIRDHAESLARHANAAPNGKSAIGS